MRCCKNCRFYLPAARGNCSESQAEKPSDMERANFCDWFSLNAALRKKHDGAQNNAGAAAKAKSAFSDLFN
jgi:hypothetical protein